AKSKKNANIKNIKLNFKELEMDFMKVILLQDVKNVGKKDQVLECADGYVRNFLLPKKLAVVADKAALAQLEKRQKDAQANKVKELEEARAMKTLLESKTIALALKTGGGDRLFGSVTNKEVAAALQSQEGIEIDRKKITIPDGIKTLGDYKAEVRLHTDVTAKVSLSIKAL
ncbi:MAG: 50S ribosomal protein L9, partial [Defluviitaleaceae bacterium]|nr:50S ribosomal protein L9 [Defluviitaleaceae bacterium]